MTRRDWLTTAAVLASGGRQPPVSAAAGSRPSLAVKAEYAVPYGRGGATELLMDVAYPATGGGPWPAVLCVHGGGWRAGHREHFSKPNLVFPGTSLIEMVAARGYVAASPSYRLVPKGVFPDMLHDVKAAVRFLRASAGRFGVRPDRVAALGASAGGHLACLLGLTRPADGLEGDGGHPASPSAVQAVVSFFGPTDMTLRTWSDAVEDAVYRPLTGARYADDPGAYRRASPVSYVHAAAPPFLFVHGTADPVVPLAQTHVLADNLAEVGASAKVIEVPGEGHGWVGPLVGRSVAWAAEFLDGVLKR